MTFESQTFTLLDTATGHTNFELPGAKPHYTPDRPGQVSHIALDVQLDLPHQRLDGTCTLQLIPIRSGCDRLSLDAVAMTIHSVSVATHPPAVCPQAFDYDGQQLQIQLDPPTQAGVPLTIAIAYSLQQPQRGLYFIAPDEDYPDKSTQVWTQGEDEDSRYWFPCFDYPGQLATSEIRVQVPQGMTAISNGILVEQTTMDGSTLFHWQQNEVHPTYLMTLAVGHFSEIAAVCELPSTPEPRRIPCPYYVPVGREAEGDRTLGKTPRMVAFFSEMFGYAYPFPKYAQVVVEDFIFGGMENTSATLLMDRCLLDERALLDNLRVETLVAHELAHQWFGDLVVIKHWSHAWLKEGMATYAEVLWTQHEYGADAAAYAHLGAVREYLEEDSSRYRRPIVTHVYREAIELYDRHLYEKASCVYRMMRAELGEELFWQAIRYFVRTHAHGTVETVDLLRAVEVATGRNLLPLFDQYVFRGGHPEYRLGYQWDGESKLAKLTVSQVQGDGDGKGLFDLTIPVGFGYGGEDGSVRLQVLKLRVHEREQAFYIPLESKPDFVSFDAGNAYLKTVVLEYPLPELKAQLRWDPDPVARIYAAEAIALKGNLEALRALAEALTVEPFWGVRVEVAKALGGMKLDQAYGALLPGLGDGSPHVRRATIEAIAQFKTLAAYKTLKAIAEAGDGAYTPEAAAIRALGGFGAQALEGETKEESILKLLRSVLKERGGWNEVIRSAAIGALAQMTRSEAALEVVLEYTVLGVPQPLRLAAIRALGAIALGQSEVNQGRILSRLTGLSRESFFLTRLAVISALGQMRVPGAIGALRFFVGLDDGRVRRLAEEAIARVQRGLGATVGVEQLRQEVEQLRVANQGVLSRLEALEGARKMEV